MAPIFFLEVIITNSNCFHQHQVHFTISSFVLWFKFSAFLYELIWLRNESDKCRSFLVNYSIYCSKSFLSSQIFYSQEIFVFLTIQSMFCFIQHSWMIIKLGVSIAKAPITQTCRVYHMASCWSLQPMLCFIISCLIDPVRVFNNLVAIHIQQWRKRLTPCFYGENF